MARTAQQIVDQTNELARQFYAVLGYEVREGYRFDESDHPQEYAMWCMACKAQEMLTDTDPLDAFGEIED